VICKICGEDKNEELFPVDRIRKHGIQYKTMCKLCYNNRSIEKGYSKIYRAESCKKYRDNLSKTKPIVYYKRGLGQMGIKNEAINNNPELLEIYIQLRKLKQQIKDHEKL